MEFEPSKLGTKKHWDEVYQRELEVFRDIGDEGEVWFGYSTQEKVVEWLQESGYVTKSDKIIEVGCGNGVLLQALAEEGYEVSLTTLF